MATPDVRSSLERLATSLGDAIELIDQRQLLLPSSPLAGSTVAGAEFARRDDYVFAHDLVARLARSYDSLDAERRRRIDLNADLPQLQFYLDEELRRSKSAEDLALERSLTFLRRHIDRLRLEYEQRVHEALEPVAAELVVALTRLTREVYRRDFAAHYPASRPHLDKFYRDYSLSGVPGGLLEKLDAIARGERYDVVVCLLRSALTHGLLLEHLGLAPSRILYLVCGRSDGSQFATDYRFEPIGFEATQLAGRRVLLCDNNAATGKTLRAVVERLRRGRVDDLGLYLDYVLEDVAGCTPEILLDALGIDGKNGHIGPHTGSLAQERLVELTRRVCGDPRFPKDTTTCNPCSA